MSNKQIILEQILKELLSNTVDQKQDPLKTLFTKLFSKDAENIYSLFDFSEVPKENNTSTTPESKKTEEVFPISVEELLRYYAPLVCETFFHKAKKTKYVLLEIVNVNSNNQDKFPVSVIYYDKQLQTKWCRPLVEFHNNFKLVM